MSDRKDVPVYLFTGFLESGKTKFIQETLEDKRFCNGERTMLLVCEEGEEEYAPDQFADKSVYIHVIEDQSELTAENLEKWLRESRAERVVVEYNGMWMLDVLYSAMPESWMVYQEFMFADAGTSLPIIIICASWCTISSRAASWSCSTASSPTWTRWSSIR